MRNDLKAVRNYVKEQLETRGYQNIELRTVTYTRRIEIVKAEKAGSTIAKLLTAGIGKDGLGFFDT